MNPTRHPQPTVAIIAAVGRDGELGKDNRLPWHLPDDLKHFKALTLGHPVIMGKNTWLSLGRPLPQRRNLVVSRTLDASALPQGVACYPTLDAALAACAQEQIAFVIGGAQLYAAALPRAELLFLTEVDANVPADAFFPSWPQEEFIEVARQWHPADERHAYPFALVTYRRRVGS